MSDNGDIYFTFEGLDELNKAFDQFPNELGDAMKSAGDDTGKLIVRQPGLMNYPPTTAANMPPTPFYIRGRGTQYASGNDEKSERYETYE